MATAGSCLHDPVSGIAGDIYSAWTGAADTGFDARATTDGEMARKRLAACIDAIAASIAGNVGFTSLSRSASFTAAPGAHYRVNCTTGNVIVTLPASSTNAGAIISVKRVDASGNTITIQRAGGDLIDGATTRSLAAQWNGVQLLATSAGWDVIAVV